MFRRRSPWRIYGSTTATTGRRGEAGRGPAGYRPNLLNQYTDRDVSGNVEVSGRSSIPTVLVNGEEATRFLNGSGGLKYHGFFHKRLGYDNSDDPISATVDIQEVPGNEYISKAYIPAALEEFTYDDDGNLSSDGIWDYTWDGENRLTAMQMKSAIANVLLGDDESWLRLEYAYDFMGRRISKKLLRTGDNPKRAEDHESKYTWREMYWSKYVYDSGSWNLSVALTCNAVSGAITGADQSFAWGPDLSGTENGAGGIGGLAIYTDDFNDGGGGSGVIGAMFPIYDGNGNVTALYSTALVHGSTTVPTRMAEWRYGPFGEARGQTGTQAARFPFRWSTKITDNETGLVYYGYRYYSASLGRWISRDPTAERNSLNLTWYVGNDPTDLVDPYGLWIWPTGKRQGERRALMVAECGDTVTSAGKFALLDPSESEKWLQDWETGEMVKATDSIKPLHVYSVPNTIYATAGDLGSLGPKSIKNGIPQLAKGSALRRLNAYVDKRRSQGFHVIMSVDTWQWQIKSFLHNKDTFGWFFIGHGAEGVLWCADPLNTNDGNATGLLPIDVDGVNHHKFGEVILMSCESGRAIWRAIISPNGWLWSKRGYVYPDLDNPFDTPNPVDAANP